MSSFYKINFEKEINLQGRSTIFLSIEADPSAFTGQFDALWVAPYIQAQTFESKFEGYPVYLATPPASLPSNCLFFTKETFAKNGQSFTDSSWDAIKTLDYDGPLLADEIKAVTMYRRTMNGETPSTSTGASSVVKFTAKVQEKGIIDYVYNGIQQKLYWIEVSSDSFGSPLASGEEFLVQVGKWHADDNWYISQINAGELSQRSLKRKSQGTPITPYAPITVLFQNISMDYANP